MWSILGGGALDAVRSEAGANDAARDAGRRLVGRGYAGLITAATFQSELTHLGVGFYANVGATGEVVEERRARLGLPPVFLQKQWVSWVELETGAELHVRLLLASNEPRSPSRLERLVTRGRHPGGLHPSLVASYPIGASWPAAPDLSKAHRRTRRVRRWASAAILFAGTSTSSTPSRHPSAAGCTWCWSSYPSGPASPPGPSSPWPGWPSSLSAGASCGASGGPGGWPSSSCRGRSCCTWWPRRTSRSRSSPSPSSSSFWSIGGTSRPPRTGRRFARPSSPSGSGPSASSC